jgi:DNA-binding response OmpR family regulator
MTKTPFILIVEDDDWMAEQHARTLRSAGFSSEVVTHAFAAIDAIDVRVPDAVILDFLLTGQNALALLHELQSHSDLASIPVILCTNSASDIAADELVAYGVVAVLDKTTMYPDDIVAAIRKVLP